MTGAPALHVPDEPVVLAERWLDAVREGSTIEQVVAGPEGIAAWFWSRWRSLGSSGVGEQQLEKVVLGYRREIWLWLAGERTWAQSCSGLIGRVERRLVAGDGTGV